MRIDRLTIANFKGFEQREFYFHPQFNLLVGKNGTGKSSALDASAVALGSWFLGIKDWSTRGIRADEVTLTQVLREQPGEGGESFRDVGWERRFPSAVAALGVVHGEGIEWSRALNAPKGRTTHGGAVKIKRLAEQADREVRGGEDSPLPLIAYYGTGRLWQEPRKSYQVDDPLGMTSKEEQSRFSGYLNSLDLRLSVDRLTAWIARQSWISYQRQGRVSPLLSAVERAIVRCVEGAEDLIFDADLGEVVVKTEEGAQPFSNLSDGQRCMLAMVGDIAQRAARLNPQFGSEVLERTEGVVLIDELDLHLHPRWQRTVIDNLRECFPGIQFICTTHSPFLIQSLRSGEELIPLDGQPAAELANQSVEQIARGVMGVPNPQVGRRYEEMKEVARHYLEELEAAALAPEEKLAQYKERLAESIGPYASNPAFQAFLEMKRAAKLGE